MNEPAQILYYACSYYTTERKYFSSYSVAWTTAQVPSSCRPCDATSYGQAPAARALYRSKRALSLAAPRPSPQPRTHARSHASRRPSRRPRVQCPGHTRPLRSRAVPPHDPSGPRQSARERPRPGSPAPSPACGGSCGGSRGAAHSPRREGRRRPVGRPVGGPEATPPPTGSTATAGGVALRLEAEARQGAGAGGKAAALAAWVRAEVRVGLCG